MLSPGSTYEDVREFLGEASHMKQFSCNHIVRLLGIVSKQVRSLHLGYETFRQTMCKDKPMLYGLAGGTSWFLQKPRV